MALKGNKKSIFALKIAFLEAIFEIDKANAFTFLSRKSFARVDKLWPNNAPALWKTGELVIDLELRYFG